MPPSAGSSGHCRPSALLTRPIRRRGVRRLTRRRARSRWSSLVHAFDAARIATAADRLDSHLPPAATRRPAACPPDRRSVRASDAPDAVPIAAAARPSRRDRRLRRSSSRRRAVAPSRRKPNEAALGRQGAGPDAAGPARPASHASRLGDAGTARPGVSVVPERLPGRLCTRRRPGASRRVLARPRGPRLRRRLVHQRPAHRLVRLSAGRTSSTSTAMPSSGSHR